MLCLCSVVLALFAAAAMQCTRRRRTASSGTRRDDGGASMEDGAWQPGWFNWTKSSPKLLSEAEKRILSCLRVPYVGRYVDIGAVVGDADRVWTISFNEASPKTPVVLLHGMGAGVALWVMNLNELAADRPVYAIDLLGFGRSSRPTFSSKGKIAKMQLVTFLEEWRREMKLDKMILLGHSLGGYLSALYTMQYPERVRHLILADSWGIAESPDDVFEYYKLPIWVRMVRYLVLPLNPLWALRFAGPLGEKLIVKARAPLVAKFSPFVPNAEDVVPKYLHQCNCQKPSGESAFHAMMHYWAFAKDPIIRKKHRLHPDTSITMIFGSDSWVDHSVGESFKENRQNIDIHIIPNCGHHIYLDQPEIFNKIVFETCRNVDSTS